MRYRLLLFVFLTTILISIALAQPFKQYGEKDIKNNNEINEISDNRVIKGKGINLKHALLKIKIQRIKNKIKERIRNMSNVSEREVIKRYMRNVMKKFRPGKIIGLRRSVVRNMYRHRIAIAKQTFNRFKVIHNKWKKAYIQCKEHNNCSNYLNITKSMILNALNVSIERMKRLNLTNLTLVNELEEYSELVKSINNISELREYYPEIRNKIKIANQVFAKETFRTMIVLYIKHLENIEKFYPEKVREIRNELDNLLNSLYELEIKDIVKKLKEIRIKIIALGG